MNKYVRRVLANEVNDKCANYQRKASKNGTKNNGTELTTKIANSVCMLIAF